MSAYELHSIMSSGRPECYVSYKNKWNQEYKPTVTVQNLHQEERPESGFIWGVFKSLHRNYMKLEQFQFWNYDHQLSFF